MTEQPVPQPYRDARGVPICTIACWARTIDRNGKDRCALLSMLPVSLDAVCEPQARLDAAELQRLRAARSAEDGELERLRAVANRAHVLRFEPMRHMRFVNDDHSDGVHFATRFILDEPTTATKKPPAP